MGKKTQNTQLESEPHSAPKLKDAKEYSGKKCRQSKLLLSIMLRKFPKIEILESDQGLRFDITYEDGSRESCSSNQMVNLLCNLKPETTDYCQKNIDAMLSIITNSRHYNDSPLSTSGEFSPLFLAYANGNLELFCTLIANQRGFDAVLETLEFLKDSPQDTRFFIAHLSNKIPGTNLKILEKLYEENGTSAQSEALDLINIFVNSIITQKIKTRPDEMEIIQNMFDLIALMMAKGKDMDLESCFRVILAKIDNPEIEKATKNITLESFYALVDSLGEDKTKACLHKLITEGLIKDHHLLAACRYGNKLVTDSLMKSPDVPINYLDLGILRQIAHKKTMPIIKRYQQDHAAELKSQIELDNILKLEEMLNINTVTISGIDLDIGEKEVAILFDGVQALKFKRDDFANPDLSNELIKKKFLQPIIKFAQNQNSREDNFRKEVLKIKEDGLLTEIPEIFVRYLDDKLLIKPIDARVKEFAKLMKEKLGKKFDQNMPEILIALECQFDWKGQIDLFKEKIVGHFQELLSDESKQKFTTLQTEQTEQPEVRDFRSRLEKAYAEMPATKIKLKPETHEAMRLMAKTKESKIIS